MHKVASKSSKNTLAVCKALGRQKFLLANNCFKPSPSSGYIRGGPTPPFLPESCQKSRKGNFAIKLQKNLVTCRKTTLHSIASSVKNARNLLPYWSGSAVLKYDFIRLIDINGHLARFRGAETKVICFPIQIKMKEIMPG